MFIMCEKYNLEKCVFEDCKRTWKENNFSNVSYSNMSCDCLDKLTIIINLDAINNAKYKEIKIVKIFHYLLKNSSQNCLECGHQWYSYNCQDYVKNIRQLLENVVL